MSQRRSFGDELQEPLMIGAPASVSLASVSTTAVITATMSATRSAPVSTRSSSSKSLSTIPRDILTYLMSYLGLRDWAMFSMLSHAQRSYALNNRKLCLEMMAVIDKRWRLICNDNDEKKREEAIQEDSLLLVKMGGAFGICGAAVATCCSCVGMSALGCSFGSVLGGVGATFLCAVGTCCACDKCSAQKRKSEIDRLTVQQASLVEEMDRLGCVLFVSQTHKNQCVDHFIGVIPFPVLFRRKYYDHHNDRQVNELAVYQKRGRVVRQIFDSVKLAAIDKVLPSWSDRFQILNQSIVVKLSRICRGELDEPKAITMAMPSAPTTQPIRDDAFTASAPSRRRH